MDRVAWGLFVLMLSVLVAMTLSLAATAMYALVTQVWGL